MPSPQDAERHIHKAGWVISDPWTVVRDGAVVVQNGRIAAVEKGRAGLDPERVVDYGPGALMPGLVNAHTHLELSALHRKLPPCQGFLAWVQSLMHERKTVSIDQMMAGAQRGIDQLIATGCRVVGDISSLGATWPLFMSSALSGVWFHEFLGHQVPALLDEVDQKKPDKVASFAGHAPHTTAPALLAELKRITTDRGAPFSIHLAESSAEARFISSGKGEWADFLAERQIDFKRWPLPARSPVAYAEQLGLLDANTLAVHVLRADLNDCERLVRHNTSVCVCPRSNQFIHERLPDIPMLLHVGMSPCLGTDSLASNDSLNMFDEMRFVANKYPRLPSADILAMATINGARALGMENRVGALKPGCLPQMIYVDVSAANADQLLEKIIHGCFEMIGRREG